MSNSAKVSYGREGKGRVFLGWGRGTCSFELDEQTGKPIENKWRCLGPAKEPNVSALLISRAKAVLRKEQQEGKPICKYCGGNCPNEEENSLYLCDGYAGDIDGLYAKENEKTDE